MSIGIFDFLQLFCRECYHRFGLLLYDIVIVSIGVYAVFPLILYQYGAFTLCLLFSLHDIGGGSYGILDSVYYIYNVSYFFSHIQLSVSPKPQFLK